MAIYYVRHGESEANVKDLFAGQKDNSKLTDLGKEQAKKAGQELKQQGVVVTRIYASPLDRTRQTAAIIAEELGYPVGDIFYDDRILEFDMGSLTGTPRSLARETGKLEAPDAEDKKKFQARVLSFLREHVRDKGVTLMVSHAGVGRIMEATRQAIDLEDFYSVEPYPNGHAVELNLDWL